MAEDDLFVGEVNEDVRRDSMVGFLKKFKFVFIGIIAAVIAFVAFMEWRSSQDTQAGIAQSAALELAIAGDESAKDALMALSKPSAMTELALGKIEEDAGNIDAAIVSYKNVADNSSYLDSERDLARLRLFELDDSYDGAALMNPNAVFEIEAKLIEAERRHANADQDGAVEIITGLLQNDRAQSMRPILESLLIAWDVEVPNENGAAVEETLADDNLEETSIENQ